MSRSLPETFRAVATRHAAALAVKGPAGMRDGSCWGLPILNLVCTGNENAPWFGASSCSNRMNQDESCKLKIPVSHLSSQWQEVIYRKKCWTWCLSCRSKCAEICGEFGYRLRFCGTENVVMFFFWIVTCEKNMNFLCIFGWLFNHPSCLFQHWHAPPLSMCAFPGWNSTPQGSTSPRMCVRITIYIYTHNCIFCLCIICVCICVYIQTHTHTQTDCLTASLHFICICVSNGDGW